MSRSIYPRTESLSPTEQAARFAHAEELLSVLPADIQFDRKAIYAYLKPTGLSAVERREVAASFVREMKAQTPGLTRGRSTFRRPAR